MSVLLLPLSNIIVQMYHKLSKSDKHELAAEYEATFNKQKQNVQKIFADPDNHIPSLKVRQFLTIEVIERFRASTEQDYLTPELEPKTVQLALQ